MADVWRVDDAAAWDRFAAARADASFLQASAWGGLKSRYGWRATRLATGANGSIRGGVQMLVRARRLTPAGPTLGLAYVPRGPLADSADDARLLLRACARTARRAGASLLRVEPVRADHAAALASLGFRASAQFVQIPRTAVVRVDRADDDLLASFKPKMRYNIRLAARRGVDVEARQDAEAFGEFYALTEATAARQGFAIHAPAYYRSVHQAFGGQAVLFLARRQGQTLAALLAAAYGPAAVYLYGASSAEQRSCMAPHAAQWAAMRWARAQGCRRYDLWGMADPDDPNDLMAGVHRFKLGFRPEPVTYPGAFDLPIQRLRAWAVTSGALRLRAALQRRRGRGAPPSV